MYIYLPIAEVSMHIGIIIGLGGGVDSCLACLALAAAFCDSAVDLLQDTAAVAVSTEANQIVASSVSGVLAHMRRGNVDFKMGGILMAGGVIGSTLGVALFSFLREIGQIDLVIQLSYVVFLASSARSCSRKAFAR